MTCHMYNIYDPSSSPNFIELNGHNFEEQFNNNLIHKILWSLEKKKKKKHFCRNAYKGAKR